MYEKYEALKKQAEEIRKIIEAGEYEVYGLRAEEDATYNVGDICANSHQWWQDDPNPELPDDMDEEELYEHYGELERYEYNEKMQCWDGGELDGTCSIGVTEKNLDSAIEQLKNYTIGAKQIILIAGDYAERGNDIGESIIRKAEVVMAIA